MAIGTLIVNLLAQGKLDAALKLNERQATFQVRSMNLAAMPSNGTLYAHECNIAQQLVAAGSTTDTSKHYVLRGGVVIHNATSKAAAVALYTRERDAQYIKHNKYCTDAKVNARKGEYTKRGISTAAFKVTTIGATASKPSKSGKQAKQAK